MVRILSILAIVFTPVFTFAGSVDLSYFEDAILALGDLIELLIPIVIAIGLLMFIWGMVQFIISAGDDEARAVGKYRMVWGIFALFAIVAVWGIVGLLADITGVETGGEVDVPSVPL
jgi:hypothetical protein